MLSVKVSPLMEPRAVPPAPVDGAFVGILIGGTGGGVFLWTGGGLDAMIVNGSAVPVTDE